MEFSPMEKTAIKQIATNVINFYINYNCNDKGKNNPSNHTYQKIWKIS